MPFMFFSQRRNIRIHFFEDISDQHTGNDTYNMITGCLTGPGYIVITAATVCISQMQMITARDKTVFVVCINITSMNSLAAY